VERSHISIPNGAYGYWRIGFYKHFAPNSAERNERRCVSLNELENIFLFKPNIELAQQCDVFILERVL
jgi:hypothetical protein